jgi:hypothetical protein
MDQKVKISKAGKEKWQKSWAIVTGVTGHI